MMKAALPNMPPELLGEHKPPCISIYLPTHRRFPENKQDSLRFKNLLKQVEIAGVKTYGKRTLDPLIEQLSALVEDHLFWTHSLDGLAVFGSPEVYQVCKLQRTVPESVTVADTFHIKPMLRTYQAADRYHLLCLTRTEVKLYEGGRYYLDEVTLDKAVPRTMTDALGSELTEGNVTIASFGANSGDSSIRHGYSARKDEEEIDNEKFFRIVDRTITDHHSKPARLPLIVAALAEHQSLIHQISHNPYLQKEGVVADPTFLKHDELRERAWKVVEPSYHERVDKVIGDYEEARTKNLGDDDLVSLSRAAAAGRVAVLMIDSDLSVPGKLDKVTGFIEFAGSSEPDKEDILDDLAEMVIRSSGEVLVLPSEKMPVKGGAAAIYRFREQLA